MMKNILGAINPIEAPYDGPSASTQKDQKGLGRKMTLWKKKKSKNSISPEKAMEATSASTESSSEQQSNIKKEHHSRNPQNSTSTACFGAIRLFILVLLSGLVVLLTLSFFRWQKGNDDEGQFFDPESVALVASSSSVVLLVLFVLYDYFVRRRHNGLAKADAVISSLFPSQVKEQLYEQKQQKKPQQQQQVFDRFQNRRNSNNNEADTTMETTNEEDRSIVSTTSPSGPPIAEFYQCSTILFADIAGFTKWSSDRQPSDVFEFLERLYGGFDRSALAHGVFKIETIGDCYVAAAGIPEARSDHAVVMVKFSKAMLKIFSEVQDRLNEKLQTQDLALRTGIHSGPVTAGVLRGEKARFQLFGDTVNTTARHESTGKPGRIHISKETASLLLQAGLRDWIQPRRTKVYAKGKGQLETFWIVTGGNVVMDDPVECTLGVCGILNYFSL